MRAGIYGMMLALVVAPAAHAADPSDPAMSLQFDVDDAPHAPDLGAFLRERAVEAWGEAGVRAVAARFRVELSWPAERSISIRVHEGQSVLAERILVVTDPDAAKLTVWMLIKSTIKRALLEQDAAEPSSTASAVDAATEPVAEPPSVAKAVPAEVAPAPPAASYRVDALIAFSVGPAPGFAAGPAVGVWWIPWQRLRLGADVGYRLSPGVVGLVVHHFPLRVYAGWQLGDADTLTVGAVATLDTKVAVAAGRRRTAAGVDAGGFLQLRVPLDRPGAGLILRASACGRLVRQRYQLDDRDVAERPWDLGLGAGVEWP